MMSTELERVYLPCGKHAGQPITRVPVGYLRWMVQVGHRLADYAKHELKRRGSVLPDLEVSGHAIDRASLKLWGLFHARQDRDQGLNAWLTQRSTQALQYGEAIDRDDSGVKLKHNGIVFVFQIDNQWPVLKTCWPARKEESDGGEEPM